MRHLRNWTLAICLVLAALAGSACEAELTLGPAESEAAESESETDEVSETVAVAEPKAEPQPEPEPEPEPVTPRSLKRHFSQEEVLASVTENVILPGYAAAAADAGTLSESLHTLCADPALPALEQARAEWITARASWMRTEAVSFGPVKNRRSRDLVNWHPVDGDRMESTLGKRETLTANDVREFLGATQRGFGAVEYLLFGEEEATLSLLSEADSLRCPFLTALGEVLSEELAAIHADWAGTGEAEAPYADVFKGTARNALLNDAAVDELVRSQVFLLKRAVDLELGKYLGLDGVADSEAMPGMGAMQKTADLSNIIQSMQDIYLGTRESDGDGPGLGHLILGLSAETDLAMLESFQSAQHALATLPDALSVLQDENPEAARAAFDELKRLQRTLQTEVVSLLGVTVGFSDTDGDSG